MKHLSIIILIVINLFAQQRIKADNVTKQRIIELINEYENTENVSHLNKAILENFNPNTLNGKLLKAKLFRLKGEHDILQGNDILAHDFLYKAIDLYREDNTDTTREWLSKCYYTIFAHYLRQADTIGMQNNISEMYSIVNENTSLAITNYNYYFSLIVYHGTLFEKNKDENDRNLSILYSHKAIYYLKQIDEYKKKKHKINPCLVYHNLAAAYFLFFEPKQIDSVFYYIDKVSKNIDKIDDTKTRILNKINIYDAYAWSYFYIKDYSKALENIKIAENLLDKAENDSLNTVLKTKKGIYNFYITYYAVLGDYKKELEYQILLNENLQKLYDVDKNKAVNDIRVKYKVEKHKSDIENLNHTISQQKRIINLTILIIIIVILVVVLLSIIIIMRKKSVEQKLYEAALEADDKHESQHISNQVILEKMKIDYPNNISLFEHVNIDQLNEIIYRANTSLTTMEKKYIICFLAGMKSADIADMFSVEARTIYTVKYRMKKKFNTDKLSF